MWASVAVLEDKNGLAWFLLSRNKNVRKTIKRDHGNFYVLVLIIP